MPILLIAAIAFVGSHFLLSHPLRAPLVRALGERGFLGVYSLVAFVTLGWLVLAYRAAPAGTPLWPVGDVLWGIVTAVMLLASILFVGSLVGNPALPNPRAPSAAPAEARGVFAVTRHPMMWGFAIWAAVHFAAMGTGKALVFDGAIFVLAVVGSIGQDAKKRKLMGERFHEWAAQTAFLPFGRGVAWPGTTAFVGGTLLFLLATWLHPLPVGIWRWIG